MAQTLAHWPPMGSHKIGPGGETFDQLKQRVLDCRAAYAACSTDNPAITGYAEQLADAIKMLRAAYTRVGLPYVTP